ncbi:MAG: hypothetical protein KC457_21525, partial [Myxococcales bacterium]|nr:hypothetical protein [Myxococcales bacterium]
MDGASGKREREGLRLPIAATGKSSAARILDDWYVVCTADELAARGRKPLATRLYDLPIVVFRGADGSLGAL